MGILDNYKKQLEEDKLNEDNELPLDSHLSGEYLNAYQKRLNELRNDSNSMENVYQSKMAEMVQLSENEMTNKNLIITEDVDKIVVKHAYCEDCGEELISKAPPMFNPFTFERVCKHTCEKCGKIYNLDFAYPRLCLLNNNGEEIPAFTR